MDMMLVAKGGHGRLVRLSRQGDFIEAEDLQ